MFWQSGSSSGHLSSACTETTPDGTLSRLGPIADGRLGIPYENGRVTQLDLADHGPIGQYPTLAPNLVNDSGMDHGRFLSSSMSVAALNQSSCAVPMPPPCPTQASGSGTMTRSHRLQHSNSGYLINCILKTFNVNFICIMIKFIFTTLSYLAEGWGSNNGSVGHHGSRGHLCPSYSLAMQQHRHEEQCPHYNDEFKFKEAPSWDLILQVP